MNWQWADSIGHHLRVPQSVGPIPLMRIICDRYELWLGISVEQILSDYAGRCPWWLRSARRR